MRQKQQIEEEYIEEEEEASGTDVDPTLESIDEAFDEEEDEDNDELKETTPGESL